MNDACLVLPHDEWGDAFMSANWMSCLLSTPSSTSPSFSAEFKNKTADDFLSLESKFACVMTREVCLVVDNCVELAWVTEVEVIGGNRESCGSNNGRSRRLFGKVPALVLETCARYLLPPPSHAF